MRFEASQNMNCDVFFIIRNNMCQFPFFLNTGVPVDLTANFERDDLYVREWVRNRAKKFFDSLFRHINT